MFCVCLELIFESPYGGQCLASNEPVHLAIRFDFHVLPPTSLIAEQLRKQLASPKQLEYKPPIPEPEFVRQIRQNLRTVPNPFLLCEEGVGGSYFVVDSDSRKIGIFKPTDEEPGAPNNPKNLIDKPLLPPGGGAAREVAAFLLDHQGRAGVPRTYLLNDVQHSKWRSPNGSLVSKSGSIQAFVENAGDTSSLGASLFSTENVHAIGVLDIRLFNMDRNSENLLAVPCGNGQREYRLVPIDHAFILPSKLDNAYFEWFTWKQAKTPFSAETLQYIADLDIEADANTLASLGIAEDCIRTMRLSTTVLKKGAAAGLSLYDIALLVSRKNPSQESVLEKIVARTEQEEDFFASFERLVDEAVTSAKATV